MRLFVGGLSWGTDDHGLRRAFEPYGAVEEAVVISDRETGRSRGFGFVTFLNEDDARSAMEQMDGQQLDGRTIRCNEAQERQRSAGGGPGGGGGGPRRSGGGGGGRGDFGGGGGGRGGRGGFGGGGRGGSRW